MSKSKKPRHPHRIKAIHVPMMDESRKSLATQLYMRVKMLIEYPSIETCNDVSIALATMAEAKHQSAALDAASEAVNAIIDRWERVKRIGVSAQEAEILRQSAGRLDVLLPKIPVNVLKAARAMVHDNFERLQNGI